MVPAEPVIHIDDSDVVKPDGHKFETLGIVSDGSKSISTKNVYKKDYDDNKMFLKLDELGQDYVIRLTAKRKLLYHNKWTMATELRNRRKGKVLVCSIKRKNRKPPIKKSNPKMM